MQYFKLFVKATIILDLLFYFTTNSPIGVACLWKHKGKQSSIDLKQLVVMGIEQCISHITLSTAQLTIIRRKLLHMIYFQVCWKQNSSLHYLTVLYNLFQVVWSCQMKKYLLLDYIMLQIHHQFTISLKTSGMKLRILCTISTGLGQLCQVVEFFPPEDCMTICWWKNLITHPEPGNQLRHHSYNHDGHTQ